MTEPIELTGPERNAAIEQMRMCSSASYGYGFGTALDSIVAAVNMVRQGELIGTVRKRGTSYAIRRKWGWLLVHDDHIEELKQPLDLNEWRLIFRVEEVS